MLAKSVLIPLKLTVATSTADAGIHKNSWIWNFLVPEQQHK